nr:hypothetical protein [Marseillevirus cajuinensis]
MEGIWYSSTDSVLISSEKYFDQQGNYVETPQPPVFSVMSQPDFHKTYGTEKIEKQFSMVQKDLENWEELPEKEREKIHREFIDEGKNKEWESFLAQEKDKFAQEKEKYKELMASLTLKKNDIGRFYTPILCPKSHIVSSEPQGRKFFVPESLFGSCGALCSMAEFEQTEPENHKEGEPDNDGECVRLPFHYLYCKTAVDFILWCNENKDIAEKTASATPNEAIKCPVVATAAKKLKEILAKNYELVVPQQEKDERKAQKKEALSLQRENHEKIDSFEMTDRFNILFNISEYLDNKCLYNAAGVCNAEAVIGFTPKDFRIQLDKPDRPMEDKLATYKELSWLNEKDLEIN